MFVLFCNKTGQAGAIEESAIAGWKVEEFSGDWFDIFMITKDGAKVLLYGFSIPSFVNVKCGEERTRFAKAYLSALMHHVYAKLPSVKELYGDGKMMPQTMGTAIENFNGGKW